MSYNRPAPLPRRGHPINPTGWAPGQTTRRVERALPLARRYELKWLDDDGQLRDKIEIAPAMPKFEAAFSAFTHGVLIQTADGEIPIEDLMPGMTIACGNGQEETLFWKGTITIVPGAPTADDAEARLYRVTADAYGPSRPSRDLVLGPSARRLVRDATARQMCGCEAALEPIKQAADGHAVIEVLPVRPTRVYHLMTTNHATILANGVEVETYHPGSGYAAGLSADLQRMFHALFPHVDADEGFGRMLWPHLASSEDAISA